VKQIIKKNNRGGSRIGAGRPKATNPKKTKAIRVPIEILDDVMLLAKYKGSDLPLYNMEIEENGVPIIKDPNKYEPYKINHELMVNNMEEHFLVKMSGHHLKESGILADDILLVNRKKALNHGNIVIVANCEGHAVIKKYHKDGSQINFFSDNENCKNIEINIGDNFPQIWGVVTKVIRNI
jgi:SOS-response transcriptional repressor LexA